MDNTNNDFDNRKVEVEDYFSFLEIIDSDETRIKYVAKDILAKETIELSKQDINISGNIDAKEIRKLAQKIGFEESRNGRNLKNIKEVLL